MLAENFSLLESRNVTEQRPANDQSSQGGFNKTNQITLISLILLLHHSVVECLTPFLSNGETINISADDLPF